MLSTLEIFQVILYLVGGTSIMIGLLALLSFLGEDSDTLLSIASVFFIILGIVILYYTSEGNPLLSL